MITLTQVLSIDNCVVYADDTDCNLYYPLATTPRLRVQSTNDQETPVFNGLFWTDQANGSGNAVAGLAGGWINFDVNLGISDELKEKIKDEIRKSDIQKERYRQIVKQEKERLTLIAKAQGKSNIPDPDVPRVGEIYFSAIQFSEGTVTLLGEADGEFIPWSSAGGPASLIGDNNAAFAMRLSPQAAAVWYKALYQGDKAIGVRYDLKFPLRLPSLEIRAWAGSTQSQSIEREVERVWRNVDQGCGNADVERIDVAEVRRNLLEEGLVNIEINKGSAEISDEHVSQLRNLAIDLIDEKIKEIIKSRIHGLTEEERTSSLTQVMTEEVSSFVELRFTQRDVVEWQISPQGTIIDLLSDLSEAQKERRIQIVDLANPIVETVEIPIRVNAPWEENPFVTSVKVIAEYPAANLKEAWVFSKEQTSHTWRFRRPKEDDGIVRYAYEVYFKGRSEPLSLPFQESNGDINVQVGKVGVIDLKFKPHAILSSLRGDNGINVIQVDMGYKQPEEEGHFTTSLILKPDQLEGVRIERAVYEFVDAPLEYQVKYITKHGKTLEMPPKKYYISENHVGDIITSTPYQDTLNVEVELGFVPDEDLNKIIVDFQYEDEENNFQSEAKAFLYQDDDWEPALAELVQVDKAQTNFRYRYRLVSNTMVARSPWVEAAGDQTLILPVLAVRIDASNLGLGDRYMNAILSLEYMDDSHHQVVKHQMFFSRTDGQQPRFWYIPRTQAMLDSYEYSMILYTHTGERIEVPKQEGRGTFLFLQDPS